MAKLLPNEALTFDDVLLLPQYSEVTPNMVSVKTRLTKTIGLNVPLLSSAMDTVTEKETAIALSLEGGLGIIHKNMAISDQAEQVDAVKAHAFDPKEFPNAVTDGKGRLLAGAALGITKDLFERTKALIAAGVDVVVLDSAHGYSKNVILSLKALKAKYPSLPVICGNVATYEGCLALAKAGADAVKVGMGPGSICSTRIISGMGMPQWTAVVECAKASQETGVPIIADGGVKYSGDVTKALAAGADTVMIGSLFAETLESPGEKVTFEGKPYKAYRGMGSIEAMSGAHGSKDRYFQSGQKKLVAEGVSGYVPLKGHVSDVVFQLVGGLRSGMGYLGASTIPQLQEKAVFVRITSGGLFESHPHDIKMVKGEPNYDGIK